MVVDLVEETARRLAVLRPPDVAAVRAHEAPVAGFSPESRRRCSSCAASCGRMYCHYKVERMQRSAAGGRRAVRGPARAAGPSAAGLAGARRRQGRAQTAEAIADYIAGMTDRFALDERRLFTLMGGAL